MTASDPPSDPSHPSVDARIGQAPPPPRVGPEGDVQVFGADEQQAKRAFDGLADGGEISMPFAGTFWSRGFGMCTDRFGVPWMVDTVGEPQQG